MVPPGLMQLEGATGNQVWDGTQNILGGLNRLDTDAYQTPQTGYTFWSRQVSEWLSYNAYQLAKELPEVPSHADDVFPGHVLSRSDRHSIQSRTPPPVCTGLMMQFS